MNLRKSPKPPMPDDIQAITSMEELHTMEQRIQHTIAELMHQQEEHSQQIERLLDRKFHISRRLIQLLSIEFDSHHQEPTSKGVK